MKCKANVNKYVMEFVYINVMCKNKIIVICINFHYNPIYVYVLIYSLS